MTCTDADIVATALLAGDDNLSKQLVGLVEKKNAFINQRSRLEAEEANSGLKFTEQKHTMRLKAESADMKIRQIVNYKILSGEAKGQAYEKLAKEMIKSGGNAGDTIRLLRLVDEAPVKEYNDIARFFINEGENSAEAVERIRSRIANAGASLYEQQKYLNKLNTPKVDSDGVVTPEDEGIIEEASKADKALIKKGLTPNNFSKPDAEWTVIKNTVEGEEEQWKRWQQYCLSNAIIGGANEKILKKINSLIGSKNIVGKLTAKQIDSITELEELIARAYTNPEDLVKNWELRDAFNNKLLQLTSNVEITEEELKYARRLITVSRFVKEGAGFSKIVMYDAVAEQARKFGINVNNAERFYDNIIATIKNGKAIDNIGEDGMVTMADKTKIPANNLLELLIIATGDRRLPKLLRENTFTDASLLDIATQVAIGDGKEATKRILQLINKVKEMPSVNNSKDLALMTLCGKKIQPGAKKGFYNFRSMYNSSNVSESTRLKAEFEDRMANANRAEIFVDGLEDLTNKNGLAGILEREFKGGYIITNDSGWRNNEEFANLVDSVNSKLKPDEQITILYPTQSLMSNFSMEDGRLIFRSRDSESFRQMMDKVSLRTLGDAEASKVLQSLAYEITNGVSGDRIRFQPSNYKGLVDNLGESLSDQQGEFLINTKVRDENGNILRVYHSTSESFKEFDLDKARKNSDIQGIFFSSDIDESKGYGPITMECYLNIENPAPSNVYIDIIQRFRRAGINDAGVIAREELQRLGYDGVIIDNEYIVFDPSQIISIQNKLPSIGVPKNISNFEVSTLEDYIIGVGLSDEFIALADKIKETSGLELVKTPNGNWVVGTVDGTVDREINTVADLRKLFKDYGFENVNLGSLEDYFRTTSFSSISDLTDESVEKLSKAIADGGLDELEKQKDIESYVKNIKDLITAKMPSNVSNETIEGIRQGLKKEFGEDADIARREDGSYTILIFDEGALDFDKYNGNTYEGLKNLAEKYGVEFIDIPRDLSFIRNILSFYSYTPKNRNILKIVANRLGVELKPKYPRKNAVNNLKELRLELLGEDEYIDAIKEYIKRELKDNEIMDKLVFDKSGFINSKKTYNAISSYPGLLNRVETIGLLQSYTDTSADWGDILRGVFKPGTKEYDAFLDGGIKNYYTFSDLINLIHSNSINQHTPNNMYIGKNINDVMDKVYGDDGFLPYELGFLTDKDGNIKSTIVGNSMSVRFSKAGADGITDLYHNHPNGSYFSGVRKRSGDFAVFNNHPNLQRMWVILPGGGRVNITKKFGYKKASKDAYNNITRRVFPGYKLSWETRGVMGLAGMLNQAKQWDNGSTFGVFQSAVDLYREHQKFDDDVLKEFERIGLENDKKQVDKVLNYLRDDQGEIRFQRVTDELLSEKDIPITNALKVNLFKDGRTVEDIAKQYNVPIEIVKKVVSNNGAEAYGMFGNGVIYFEEMVKESTAPHELFHSIFNIVDDKKRFLILEESKMLFGYTDDEAEEELAKAFSEWFRTGKFKYADADSIGEEGTKSFYEKVKEFFRDIKAWLSGLSEHRSDVEQLFNDMVNGAYIKNDGKEVSKAKASSEYTKEIEETANRYYGAMLGQTDWNDPNFRDTVHSMLEDLTGIPITSLRDLSSIDKNKLWQVVDSRFANAQKTTGIFKNEIIDITQRIDEIEGLDLDGMKGELSKIFGDLINEESITQDNLPLLKQALEDYETAGSIEDWMEAKGRLLSMANGGNAEAFTLDQLRTIFTNGTQAAEYKQMFFPNQYLTEEQTKKYVASINNMLFDGLTISLSNNLVNMGYSLPLDSARGVVLDYLTSRVNISDNFAKAFLYKNGLPDSNAVFKSIIESAMPSDFRLGYEEAMYTLRDTKPTGKINRITTQKNPFLPDTYSALASIVNARTGVIGVTSEEEYLKGILNKYVSLIKEGLKKGIDFEQAQQLKTQVGYALDIFEQDIVMAKYGDYLTPEQKASVRNMKSFLPIVVGKEGDASMGSQIKLLEDRVNDLQESFKKGLKDIVGKYMSLKGTLAKNRGEDIKKLTEKMKENGTVMGYSNGEVVIVDARKNVRDLLDNIPSSIQGLTGITAMIKGGLDGLDNRSVYFLNSLIESAKKLDALAKWEPAIMYHMNPQLSAIRFFDSFKLVNFGVGERIPAALTGNILSSNKTLAKYNLSGLDENLKLDIFKKIKGAFNVDHTLNIDRLGDIINSSLSSYNSQLVESLGTTNTKEFDELKQLIFNQYQKAFMPYTHLRDIPSGGVDMVGTKEKINEILSNEISKIKEALDGLPEQYSNVLNRISIVTPYGDNITIQQYLDGMSPSWKKALFDDDNILISSMDEVDAAKAGDGLAEDSEELKAINLEYKKRVVNQYNDVLQSIQNQQQIVSDAERELSSRMLNNARNTAMKYSLTHRLVDASNMVGGLEEEAARMMKYRLLGFWNNLTFGRANSEEVMKRLKSTQDAYRKFYTMPLDEMNNISPTNEAEELAQHLCRYFKTLENYLGSADGVTGVTTDADINRRFYNMGETFLFVDSVKGIYAMMSAIEENQLLKFFKFSKPGAASYIREFTRPASEATEDILGGYREYVSKFPDNINKDRFNELFAANFTDTEFKSLYQALSGLTYVGGYGKTLNRLLNFINGTSFIGRLLVSYPGQLFTIPQQGIAYFLKEIGYKNRLGEYDLGEVDRIRSKYGTLDKAYNEINIFRNFNPDDTNIDSYYNRYGVPDINDVYKKAAISTVDDVNDMYAKIGNYQSTWDNTGKLIRSIDAYKDNANNIVDGLFARNFKNIAFLKGIRDNSFMQFGTVQAFEEFMMDSNISREVKRQLMDAVNAASGRNFRNILGLGFGGLDRAIGSGGKSNIGYGLMQLLNFRGAWGQNIFKQTGESIMSLALMARTGLSSGGKDKIALYLSRTPEFTNLFYTLVNDLKWTWKLQRYQDNGRRSELDNEYDIMDFLEYSVEVLNMTSQWFQGIQSFGPARPVLEGMESAWDSYRNPEVYKDTIGMGAFFNALGKNAGRNWKPRNWIFQAIQAYQEGGEEGFEAYFNNQFWKLSFGSLRYMMDEDVNNYGYTYDIINNEGGIPSIIRGEAAIDSDKTFSYSLSNANTWGAIKEFFNYDNTWDDRSTYIGDVWGAMINGSNLINSSRNLFRILPERWRELFGVGNRIAPFTMDSFTDIIGGTEAGIELIKTGRVIPKDEYEMKAFVEEFIDTGNGSSNRSNLKPFGTKFAKAINNFNQFGYVDGDEGDSRDKELEFLLTQIRYERDSEGNVKKEKKETELWKNLVQYIREHPTDETATSNDVSVAVFNWIEQNNDDPNYLLYQSLVGQGMADNYIDMAYNNFQNEYNELYGGKKADEKLTKTKAIDSGLYYRDFMRYLLNTEVNGTGKSFAQYLQELDRNSGMSASIKIIKNQMKNDYDKKALEKFVEFKKDSYGNDYVEIKNQYLSQLKAIGGVGDAIDKGDLDLLIARMSKYANTYINTANDPTGLNTARTVQSLMNRVRDADIAPGLKVKMMSALAENNIEFMQKNLEVLRKVLGKEEADKLVAAGNSLIYGIDASVNSVIGDALLNGDPDAAKSGSKLSNKIKNVMSDYVSPNDTYGASGNGYGGRSSTIGEWVPYTLDISKLLNATGGKGYSPKGTEFNVRTFKPTIDLSIGKDINRKKKTFNTQEVKKKKVVL